MENNIKYFLRDVNIIKVEDDMFIYDLNSSGEWSENNSLVTQYLNGQFSNEVTESYVDGFIVGLKININDKRIENKLLEIFDSSNKKLSSKEIDFFNGFKKILSIKIEAEEKKNNYKKIK